MSKTPFTTVKEHRPAQKEVKTDHEEKESAESTINQEEHAEETCPECDGTLIEDAEHGETICRDCGLVVKENAIDHGPEWRAFDSKERGEKKRTGAPTTETMHDRGLSTNIGWQDRDANGNMLSSRKRQQMSRLRKWHERSRADSKERGLQQGFGEINRMVSALGTSESSKETACVMFRRAQEDDLLTGRSIEGMASATVYAAIRMENTPRTLEQIEQVSRVEKKKIGRAYWYINKEMDLEISPADPLEYLPRFISALDTNDETEHIARKWIEKAKAANAISGRSPTGVAAAALYAAGQLSGDVLTQKEIAEVANVTPVTVRNRFNDLVEHADFSWI